MLWTTFTGQQPLSELPIAHRCVLLASFIHCRCFQQVKRPLKVENFCFFLSMFKSGEAKNFLLWFGITTSAALNWVQHLCWYGYNEMQQTNTWPSNKQAQIYRKTYQPIALRQECLSPIRRPYFIHFFIANKTKDLEKVWMASHETETVF